MYPDPTLDPSLLRGRVCVADGDRRPGTYHLKRAIRSEGLLRLDSRAANSLARALAMYGDPVEARQCGRQECRACLPFGSSIAPGGRIKMTGLTAPLGVVDHLCAVTLSSSTVRPVGPEFRPLPSYIV
jgi:hypothetical protein